MKLGFRSLAILSASVCFTLAFIWMLAPGMLLATWGVGFSDAVGVVGRRGGALFFGIGVMFFRARNLAPSRARQTIVTGFVSACLALAALGIFELATGHAGFGILSAVLAEVAIALLFLACGREEPTVIKKGTPRRPHLASASRSEFNS
jgi:peptidoglycan/LPS O-acetylase OafA/YrhL